MANVTTNELMDLYLFILNSSTYVTGSWCELAPCYKIQDTSVYLGTRTYPEWVFFRKVLEQSAPKNA